MDLHALGKTLVASLAFSLLGILLFGFVFVVIQKVTPFSIRKELETDHNVAMAIVLAAVILGVAIIVAAAVHGS
ncbi:MAG: DUF350 domain-containing protein [Myxococcales bacterium]|nr:DUF350 domain-containing protein [Myxococcales bacterium]